MKSVGIRNKSQQDIMHSIFQEYLYHSDFVYVSIHLYKYNVRVININAVKQQQLCITAIVTSILSKYI